LIENVAPIQLGISLAYPGRLATLELEDVRQLIEPFDPQSLAYPWKSADPRLDALSEIVQKIAAAVERQKGFADFYIRTYLEGRSRHAELPLRNLACRSRSPSKRPVPQRAMVLLREPTQDQLVSIGARPSLS